MQRMIWLSCLYGLLFLISNTYSNDADPKKEALDFTSNLKALGFSDDISQYGNQLYGCLKETNLSTVFDSSEQLKSTLDSGWNKEFLSVMPLDKEQEHRINKLIRHTPLQGDNSDVDYVTYSKEPSHFLLIFVGSHPTYMIKLLSAMKRIFFLEVGIELDLIPFNTVLIGSSGRDYSINEHLPLIGNDHSLTRYTHELSANKSSQLQFGHSLFEKHFPYSHVFDRNVENHEHHMDVLEKLLSDTNFFSTYNDVILITLQPFCKEASIHSKALLPESITLIHLCHDPNLGWTSDNDPLDSSHAADRLIALKRWILATMKYDKKRS